MGLALEVPATCGLAFERGAALAGFSCWRCGSKQA